MVNVGYNLCELCRRAFWAQMRNLSVSFDIIIDDGSKGIACSALLSLLFCCVAETDVKEYSCCATGGHSMTQQVLSGTDAFQKLAMKHMQTEFTVADASFVVSWHTDHNIRRIVANAETWGSVLV